MLISRIAERLGPRVWEADAAEIAQVASALARTRACPPSIVRIGLTGRGSLQDPAVLEGVCRADRLVQRRSPFRSRAIRPRARPRSPMPSPTRRGAGSRGPPAASPPRSMCGRASPSGCGAEVLACGADVVSVDLDSDSARTCEELTGRTDHAEALGAAARSIIGRRRAGPGAIRPCPGSSRGSPGATRCTRRSNRSTPAGSWTQGAAVIDPAHAIRANAFPRSHPDHRPREEGRVRSRHRRRRHHRL